MTVAQAAVPPHGFGFAVVEAAVIHATRVAVVLSSCAGRLQGFLPR
ncbi:hypothetical protein [Streptomyces sp. NPDC059928]